MDDITTGFRTTFDFIAFGVSYALLMMNEGTVVGVSLLRNRDFNAGYRVKNEGVTGTVYAIDLQKPRIDTDDGDRIVTANRGTGPRWMHNSGDA